MEEGIVATCRARAGQREKKKVLTEFSSDERRHQI